tara:strand:- start:1021 stop:1275 length:255 start_codon:yes stop_codon:yes gene_type:complete
MNKEEIENRKIRNRELRKNAPIPKGVEDLRDITWRNKHNSTVIKIISSKVTDSGTVVWYSDTGEFFLTRDLNGNWNRINEEELE